MNQPKKITETTVVNAEKSMHDLINVFDDTEREGLNNTPRRYVKFLNEFLHPEPFQFTTFDSENYDQMIIVKNIPFFSLCEHHLAPFFGTAAIAYIPKDRIVGLSKLPRTLEMFARRLQNQERITTQVALYLQERLEPVGVGVLLKARHLCVEMRGVEKAGAETITSKLLGNFKEDSAVRAEFMSLVNNGI